MVPCCTRFPIVLIGIVVLVVHVMRIQMLNSDLKWRVPMFSARTLSPATRGAPQTVSQRGHRRFVEHGHGEFAEERLFEARVPVDELLGRSSGAATASFLSGGGGSIVTVPRRGRGRCISRGADCAAETFAMERVGAPPERSREAYCARRPIPMPWAYVKGSSSRSGSGCVYYAHTLAKTAPFSVPKVM
ncbi:hypothetical protein CYMTET_16968 [Cymbomonas tetramitiformis]|uniref:Uncharacterized protein n=1 Tax=Cymbomonas tetramitiformis TaxID=36881 RepID=A0AAE0GBB0_9CHLO|nr:hypothetical protein CYMTET_16968 [Cymbomonas tetramitiformis]